MPPEIDFEKRKRDMFRYGTGYQRCLRLFEDIKLLKEGHDQLVTPSGYRITVVPQGELPVFYIEPSKLKGEYKGTRCQWAHINQVEKRLIACGIDVDTAVDDKGRWVIRLTNVDGAESIDMIFSAQSEYFTKLEVNE